MIEKDLPGILRPFYEPPQPGSGFSIHLSKNRAYVKDLVQRREEVREVFCQSLMSLKAGYPEQPGGSFAVMHILDAASKLAGPVELPIFIEMLDWDWVQADHQYPVYVLEAFKYGHTEDIPRIEEFCRQYACGPQAVIEKQRVLEIAQLAIESCRMNGPRGEVLPSLSYRSDIPDCRGYTEK